MRYFFNLLPIVIIGLLISCVDRKEQTAEKEEIGFESNVVVGEGSEEGRSGQSTVYEAVADNETLYLMKAALHTTNLDSVLQMEGPFTVFAPSDAAFEALDPTGQNNLPADLDEGELKEILLHHVVEGNYRAADLTDGKTLTTLAGDQIHIMMQDNELVVDSASVVFADREADNGYVHIIDQVLMPM